MGNFLITRPTHDSAVSYLHSWSRSVLDFAREKNISVSDFNGEKANRNEVSKFLAKQKPKFVVFNGHGSPTTVE